MNFLQVVGKIEIPEHLNNGYGGLESGMGLIGFISNIVKLIMVLGGIWTFFNLLIAGFIYITSGDKPDELKKANDKITMSLIGLVLLVGSVILAGIFGYILYGNPSAILNPQIYGPK